MSILRENATFTARDEVVACDLDDGRALLDLNESKYYKLNGSAALIWEWIADGSTVEHLAAQMMEKYDVEEARCKDDIKIVLSSFLGSGLIEQNGGEVP